MTQSTIPPLPPSPYPAPKWTSPPGAKQNRIIKASEAIRTETISCTSCGGKLDIEDKAKSAMIVCKYCGAALNITQPENADVMFKAGKRYEHGPLGIGMTGRLLGQSCQVMGMIQYEQEDDGVYTWRDYQIRLGDGQYVFLTEEEGHWVLHRNVRKKINLNLMNLYVGRKFNWLGKKYLVFENGTCEITHVEGELTWVARKGDTVDFIDAIAPPYCLGAEKNDKELEWTYGKYKFPTEIAKSFNIDPSKMPSPEGVYPCQPFIRTAVQKQLIKISVIAAACLTLALIFTFTKRGKEIFNTSITAKEYTSDTGHLSSPFDFAAGTKIYELKAYAPVHNSWVSFGINLLNDNDQAAYEVDSTIERYHGRTGGESWSEGSQSSTKLFKATGPKRFRLLTFGDNGSWTQKRGSFAGRDEPLRISLREGVYPMRYLVIALIISLIYPFKEIFRQASMESMRSGDND